MQTPAILNSANVTPASKPGTLPVESSGGDSFQNMLSQQVADRQAAKPAENTQQSASQNTQQAAKPADSQAPDKAQAAGKSDNPQDAKAKPTDDAEQSQAVKGKNAKDDDQKAAADAAAIPPTATELIAQALNVNVRSDAAPADAKGKQNDALLNASQTPLARGRLLATAEASLKPAATDGKAIVTEHVARRGTDKGGDTDFAAAMKQGGEQLRAAGAAAEAQAVQTAAKAVAAQADDHALPVATTLAANPAHVQQAGFDLAQAVNGQAERLTPRVGTPAWDQALGQKVVWMVGGAQQSASLTLNPPDLGPLQVVLNVHNGQADASFYAAQPEVRQALEAALPKLRDMMSDSGIQLGQASVSAGMPDQFNQQGGQSLAQGPRNTGSGNDFGGGDTAPQVVRSQVIQSGQGLVDTFV